MAQVILYGTGGWTGPVFGTSVTLGGVALAGARIAIAAVREPNNFGDAGGILGLAYNALNSASNTGKPTYTWHYPVQGTAESLGAFENELAQFPATDVDPYFSQLAAQGVVANKFGVRSVGGGQGCCGDCINPGGPLSQSMPLDRQRFEAKSWIPLAEWSIQLPVE